MKTRLMVRGTQMNTMAQVCDGTCGHDLRQRVKGGVIQEIQSMSLLLTNYVLLI